MVRKYINILRDNHQIKNNESENNECNEKHLKTYNLSVKNLCNAKYNKDLLWLVAILKNRFLYIISSILGRWRNMRLMLWIPPPSCHYLNPTWITRHNESDEISWSNFYPFSLCFAWLRFSLVQKIKGITGKIQGQGCGWELISRIFLR